MKFHGIIKIIAICEFLESSNFSLSVVASFDENSFRNGILK